MTTINDVAKRAGVSVGTVSNVINGANKVSPKTSERVMNAKNLTIFQTQLPKA